ncbi:MAG: alanine:cation symporter family protein, partial [Oscillospiraceae bacterium]|nr:alanine:cation symporter family protein [Oscillospiraceae bacterium]
GVNLLPALKSIITSAMGFGQIAGGFCGAAVKKAVSHGLRRGIFSNEAGMGSSVLVHTETECKEPVQMGMWAVAEVVIDTIICCTLTALVILVTGAEGSGKAGLAMAAEGFRRGLAKFTLGEYSADFVAVSAIIFAFCTLLGWYFYGEKCLTFITKNKKVLFAFRALYTAAAFVGAVSRLELVWGAADIMNWVMLVINLFAVILLSGEAAAETRSYIKKIKKKPK